MDKTPVEDDETVYRRIWNDPQWYSITGDGKVKISANAFRDRQQEPSVERAKLCNYDPRYSIQDYPDNGVVTLAVKDIRKIKTTVFNAKQRPASEHATDVEHRPSKKTNAHAAIMAVPAFPTDNGFGRFKESLAQLATKAGFTILPEKERKRRH